MKWHAVNSAAAQTLTSVTNSPGAVYALTTPELPQPLQRMPGVSSYYVTGYTTGQSLPEGLTLGGELLVARVDGPLAKNYQFAFAISSERQVSQALSKASDITFRAASTPQSTPCSPDAILNGGPRLGGRANDVCDGVK